MKVRHIFFCIYDINSDSSTSCDSVRKNVNIWQYILHFHRRQCNLSWISKRRNGDRCIWFHLMLHLERGLFDFNFEFSLEFDIYKKKSFFNPTRSLCLFLWLCVGFDWSKYMYSWLIMKSWWWFTVRQNMYLSILILSGRCIKNKLILRIKSQTF